MAGLSAFEPITRQEMAGLLGVSLRTFAEIEAKGAVTPLVRGKGGAHSTYDVRVTIRAYLAYKAKETPRDRLFRLQADKVELEVKTRTGELVEGEAVDSEWATIATALRRDQSALPGRLAQLGFIRLADLGPVTEACLGVLRHLGTNGKGGA